MGLEATTPSWMSRWLPVAAWAAVIWFLSTDSFSGEATSGALMGILGILLPWLDPPALRAVHDVVRKLAHPAEYALLAILLLRALRHPRRSIYASAASALALSALYATSDEIHQTFTVSRVGAVTDVVLDTIGAAIGVTMAAAWQARLNSDR